MALRSQRGATGGRTNRSEFASTQRSDAFSSRSRLPPVREVDNGERVGGRSGRGSRMPSMRETFPRSSRCQSVDPYRMEQEKRKAVLQEEVQRLRNPSYAPIRSPLPSPSMRMNELPNGQNQFSVPQRSVTSGAMCRSSFLDETINNQLKQRTRSELLQRQHKTNEPHASYDIDGDGFISQADYALAKRFDADGNGVIDKEEMDAGKRLIAKELWEKYRAQHFLQKPPITDVERQLNVDKLVALKDQHGAFMRDYEKVKNKHWIEEQRGSAQVLECVAKPHINMFEPSITQHPVPCGIKPKTRTELFALRRKNYADDVNQRAGNDIREYGDHAIFRNYNQRDKFVSSDVNSYARKG